MYIIDDFAASSRNMRSWLHLGLKRLQLDNRRMMLGSLWLFLSFAIMAVTLAMLISELQGLVFREHVRYVTFGLAAFNFMQGAIVGGSLVFTSNRSFMLQLQLPKSAFAHALVTRVLIIFGAQLTTAVIIALISGWQPSWMVFAALPAMLIYILTAYGVILLLGCLTARVRDLSEFIAAIMRVSFFFTPIIWLTERRGARILRNAAEVDGFSIMGFLYTWNPLTHFLQLIRAPLLGEWPTVTNYAVAGTFSVLLIIAGLVTLQLTGRRLTYWL